MREPFSEITGLMLLASATAHAEQFSLMMLEMYENRCSYCGYMRDHPVARHDSNRGECGWR